MKLELRQIGVLIFPASLPIYTGHEKHTRLHPNARKGIALRWAIWRRKRAGEQIPVDKPETAS